MASIKYTGSGVVTSADFRYIKYVGKTKSNKAITIEMTKAFCNSNPDWSFAEKDDTVATLEFEGCYTDTALEAGTMTEPWTIDLADGLSAGTGEILLGVGKFYIGTSASDATLVGLTRGGGSFVVERTYREINADNDPGKVVDRVVQDEGRPKMTLNALEFITKINKLYTGIVTA